MDQKRLSWRLNPRKIYLRDLDINEDTDNIISLCSKYGRILKFNRTLDKKKLFFTYLSECHAAQALLQLPTFGYKVSYACDKVKNDPAGNDYSASNDKPAVNTTGRCPLQVCTNCGTKSELNCVRCGAPYCSKLCQAGHWLIHQKVCISIPDLVLNLSSIDETKPKTTESIKKTISRTNGGKKRAYNGDTSDCPQSKVQLKKLEDRETVSQVCVTAPNHYPEVKVKRGVCHICNDLTREYCSLCQLYLCISKENCFLKFHIGKSDHFADHVGTKPVLLCKNCNERKAKYQCLQCSDHITAKKAYFCINSRRNCFQMYHISNHL